MSERVGDLMVDAEIAIGKIEAWLEAMRQDPLIGKDIQELQSWKPDSLSRVLLIAVLSYKKFVV